MGPSLMGRCIGSCNLISSKLLQLCIRRRMKRFRGSRRGIRVALYFKGFSNVDRHVKYEP